ncbi:peptidyl-Lys metalloendopeptidase [Flagelloscypha sp. PMI_526]|nr:peptidyl-Lys metalloendopeptidase [Flagelloscypha sp. PMI_526]
MGTLSLLFLTCLAFCHIHVSATRQLTLSLSGPTLLKGNGNLTITATVKNTGHLELKILNEPGGILDTLPTNTFNVSHKGCAVQFAGVLGKYVPQTIIKSNNASLFTFLKPGESISVQHNLNLAYNFTGFRFTQPGGNYLTIAPNSLNFLLAPSTGITPTVLRAQFPPTFLRIRIPLSWGPLFYPPFIIRPSSEKFVGCSATQKKLIHEAAGEAMSLASSTYNYIASTTTGTPRYTTWFGTYHSTRRDIVWVHFYLISSNNFRQFTYDCTCNDARYYAFVQPHTFGAIGLCGMFWNASMTGTDSKSGTLIHEASHFIQNGGTLDIHKLYGQRASQTLARDEPDLAVFNADSHEYFAENTPILK